MSDFFAIIKLLIEKVNIYILFFSLAVSIVFFKVWMPDVLWAFFVFCLSYPVFAGIYKLYIKRCTRIYLMEKMAWKTQKEQEQKEKRMADLFTVYESLSSDVKKGLVMLYRLPIPSKGIVNSRIVDKFCKEHQIIWNAVCAVDTIIIGNHALVESDIMLNNIINIDLDFYCVLEEKSKTFEEC